MVDGKNVVDLTIHDDTAVHTTEAIELFAPPDRDVAVGMINGSSRSDHFLAALSADGGKALMERDPLIRVVSDPVCHRLLLFDRDPLIQ